MILVGVFGLLMTLWGGNLILSGRFAIRNLELSAESAVLLGIFWIVLGVQLTLAGLLNSAVWVGLGIVQIVLLGVFAPLYLEAEESKRKRKPKIKRGADSPIKRKNEWIVSDDEDALWPEG